jgi:hypothetical protein
MRELVRVEAAATALRFARHAVERQIGLRRGTHVLHPAVGEIGDDRLVILRPGKVDAEHA